MRIARARVGPGAAIWVTITLLAGLSGCLNQRPDLPPVFSVDEIRYWWEGDFMVVNVTITNRQNFTPGIDTMTPWIRVWLQEYNRTDEKANGYPGVIYRNIFPDVGIKEFTLYVEPSSHDPWQTRWYDESARKALGIPIARTAFGPATISPNASLAPEIVYKPSFLYRGLAGHYSIQVSVLANYPASIANGSVGGSSKYHSGCFNLDTPEFYGFDKSTGKTCNYWDCTGRDVSEYSVYENGMKRRLPACPATKFEGPHFEG